MRLCETVPPPRNDGLFVNMCSVRYQVAYLPLFIKKKKREGHIDGIEATATKEQSKLSAKDAYK